MQTGTADFDLTTRGPYPDRTASFVQTVQLGPTTTSWSAPIDPYYATAYTIDYTVTTQTDYGWTKESAHTPTFGC